MTQSGKYILFKMGSQSFAIDVQQVISIERMQQVTEVPNSKAFVKGITVIRNETTAVVDLRERLNVEVKEETDETRIIVVSLDGMQVGLIVDAAKDVKNIDEEEINEAPPIISDVRNQFLNGVVRLNDELVLILDIEKILDFTETNELKKIINN